MRKRESISIVITFHSEGIIAHKTMRNVFSLLEPLVDKGVEYEIIAHLDNPTEETAHFVERYGSKKNVRIFKNSFGDPSEARNFAISKAANDIIAVIDGDDIYSKSWLEKGYEMIVKESKPQILHVEYDVTFGNRNNRERIWRMSNSGTLEDDTLVLFTRNRWSAGYITKKRTIEGFKYKRAKNGFGYEDWVFNCDTRKAGIEHNVVPKSIKFYRVKEESVYAQHVSDGVITDYTDLFSTDYYKKIGENKAYEYEKIKPSVFSMKRRIISCAYRVMEQMPYARNIVSWRKKTINRKRNNLEEWFLQEWTAANEFDGAIYPSQERIDKLDYYSSEESYLGILYGCLVSRIRRNPDYIFMPPQLNIGGTEKVIMNYIRAFSELHPDWYIVVLSSIPESSKKSLPKNVDFVAYYELVGRLAQNDQDILLSRFVVQTKAKRLHVIHNEFMYDWIRRHKKALKVNECSIYASQFMNEYNDNKSLRVGFVDPFITSCYDALDCVFTDNSVMRAEMIERFAFDKKKVKVHYQPIEMPENDTVKHSRRREGRMKILWASRIAPQKRPDLLKKIAEKLDPSSYQIDVYGRMQPPFNEKFFSEVSNIVTYKGKFANIKDIDVADYDVFLYTSQVDGLPNILLEVASYGVPIVASNIGGVSDLIDDGTGFLVEMEDIEGYVSGIKKAERCDRAELSKNMREKLRSRHSWKAFLEQVREDIN